MEGFMTSSIVYMDAMANDFVKLCNELDDFMLNFDDVDKVQF
jgi:hypothetical protein